MSRTNKDKPPKLLYGDKVTKKPRGKYTEWHWLQNTPSWWTNLFMNRPQRKEAQRWERNAQKTNPEDIDELDTPNVSKKPHKYYW